MHAARHKIFCMVFYYAFAASNSFAKEGSCSETFGVENEKVSSSEEMKLRSKILQEAFDLLTSGQEWHNVQLVAKNAATSPKLVREFFPSRSELFAAIASELEENLQRYIAGLARKYAALAKEGGRTLNLEEFSEKLAMDESNLTWLFDYKHSPFRNFIAFKDRSKQDHEKSFANVIDTDVFNAARAQRLLKAIKTKKRLVVTTAVAGATVNEDFLASLRTYCQENDAALVVLPADMRTNGLDEALLDQEWIHVVTNEVELSQYLRIANLKVNPNQADPLSSLDIYGKRSQSLLVASPVLAMRVIATETNARHPHFLISTGALTDPYLGEKLIPSRQEALAENRHRLGAVVLELQSSEAIKENHDLNLYHMRHIEWLAGENGFFDINQFYTARSAKASHPLAIVLGDLHVAALDRKAFAAAVEQIKRLKPKYLVLHDLFDGASVNHHNKDKKITRAAASRGGEFDLKAELKDVVEVLDELLAADPNLEIVVTRANHDLWLDQWLESGEFMNDPQNQPLGLLLATAMSVYGETNPLAYALTKLGRDKKQDIFPYSVSDPKRLKFLETGEDLSIGPEVRLTAVGFHGHVGANGAKPASVQVMARASNRSVIGHTHTVARLNDAVNVGTLSLLDMVYNREGVNNWVQSIALVGANGALQILNFANGEFNATEGRESAKKPYFEAGYPILVPNNE